MQDVERLAFEFMQSDPIEVLVEAREKSQDYLARVPVTPAPVEIALTFGDAMQNFRATLDYMTQALVIANGGVPIDGGRQSTQFPIHRVEPAEFRVSPGVADDALSIIEGVQPYKSCIRRCILSGGFKRSAATTNIGFFTSPRSAGPTWPRSYLSTARSPQR